MQITMRSTDRIVELVVRGVNVPARIWTGTTANGIRVEVLVTRIAVREDADCSQFERELKEQAAPTPVVQAFPLRMLI